MITLTHDIEYQDLVDLSAAALVALQCGKGMETTFSVIATVSV
jgi:hypothetical protein